MNFETWIKNYKPQNPMQEKALQTLINPKSLKRTHEGRHISAKRVKLIEVVSEQNGLVKNEREIDFRQNENEIRKSLKPEFINIVFFNGRFVPGLSDLNAEVLKEDLKETDSFDFISAASSLWTEKKLVFELTGSAKPYFVNFFATGKFSNQSTSVEFKILENQNVHLLCGAQYLTAATAAVSTAASEEAVQTKIIHINYFLQKNSSLELTNWTSESDSSQVWIGSFIKLQENAKIQTIDVNAGGVYTHRWSQYLLSSSSSEVRSYGLNILSKNEICENQTLIDHQIGACFSEQKFKNILDGRSQSIFSGQIRIRPHAQKASSDQQTQSLLLSETAESVAQPQLMIEADDVKATHGATVGQINDDEIFYLMSRGISRLKAKQLLSEAFANEILEKIEHVDVKNWMTASLRERLSNLDIARGSS